MNHTYPGEVIRIDDRPEQKNNSLDYEYCVISTHDNTWEVEGILIRERKTLDLVES